MAWFFGRKKDRLSAALRDAGGLIWLGDSVDAGVAVNRETAIEIATVFAAINTLVQDVGQIPFAVYERSADGRTRTRADWIREAVALKWGPNDYQTAQDWLEQCMLHVLIYGDHYARLGRVGAPDERYVAQWFPYSDPSAVRTEIIGGRKVHHVWDAAARTERTVRGADMLHVHGPSVDGYTGRDIVDTHRQTLSLAKALYRYGSRWFANGGQPRGILILPASAKADDIAAAKRAFIAAYGGDNVHGVAAYSHGTDYKPVSVDPERSQMIGAREAVSKDIAALFRVPLWKLTGDPAPSDEARRAYYADTLGPWFVRIAGAMNKWIIPRPFYCEANTAAVLRSDIKTRSDAYRTMIEARILSPNEARAMENRPPYEGGGLFLNPNTTAFNGPDGGADE